LLDEQGLVVHDTGRARVDDRRIEQPRVPHAVGQPVGAAVVDVALDLLPHLVDQLLLGALLGGLAVEHAGRVPVGDDGRERLARLPVAVAAQSTSQNCCWLMDVTANGEST
jgi:hypothetical protein